MEIDRRAKKHLKRNQNQNQTKNQVIKNKLCIYVNMYKLSRAEWIVALIHTIILYYFNISKKKNFSEKKTKRKPNLTWYRVKFWLATYLYGISLKLLWLCECGTLLLPSLLTPHTANSCADPVRLRSLPRRRDNTPVGFCAVVLTDGTCNSFRIDVNKTVLNIKKIQFPLSIFPNLRQKCYIWWRRCRALLFGCTAKAEEAFFMRRLNASCH